MLFIIIASVIILSCICTLHCTLHFKLRICKPKLPKKMGVTSNSVTHSKYFRRNHTNTSKLNIKNIGKCGLDSVEEFNFFPMSFLMYILFTIGLCIIILIHEISIYSHETIDDHHDENISDLILYYIVLYGIMVMSLWESLFAFYKFFTAHKTTTSLLPATSLNVIKRFSLYSISFIVLYIITIHFCYWLFTVNILLTLTFNFYCNYHFGALLVRAYLANTEKDSSTPDAATMDMLNRVYFMRRISLTCTFLQFIYFAASIITKSITVIHYMPILWSLNIFINALNFVRFRHGLQNIFRCAKKIESKLIITSEVISTNKLHPKHLPLTHCQTNVERFANPYLAPAVLSHHKTIYGRGSEGVKTVHALGKSVSQPVPIIIEDDSESASTLPVETPDSMKLGLSLKSTVSLNNVYQPAALHGDLSHLKNHVSAPTVCHENDGTVFIAYESSENKCAVVNIETSDGYGDKAIECKESENEIRDDEQYYRTVATLHSIDELVRYGFYTKTEMVHMQTAKLKRISHRRIRSAPFTPNV